MLIATLIFINYSWATSGLLFISQAMKILQLLKTNLLYTLENAAFFFLKMAALGIVYRTTVFHYSHGDVVVYSLDNPNLATSRSGSFIW